MYALFPLNFIFYSLLDNHAQLILIVINGRCLSPQMFNWIAVDVPQGCCAKNPQNMLEKNGQVAGPIIGQLLNPGWLAIHLSGELPSDGWEGHRVAWGQTAKCTGRITLQVALPNANSQLHCSWDFWAIFGWPNTLDFGPLIHHCFGICAALYETLNRPYARPI